MSHNNRPVTLAVLSSPQSQHSHKSTPVLHFTPLTDPGFTFEHNVIR